MKQAISLEALEVLDAIDLKGSFAAAANALYRVPSAITYQVQKLEEDLGVVLFKREGRRSRLTPAGRVLLEQGRELIAAAERLTETTRQVDSGWESRFDIAIDSILEFEPFYHLIEKLYRPRRVPLDEVLVSRGAELGDVVAVVNSHLHFDHCGGNRLFPGVPIHVQRAEYEATRTPHYTVREWVDFPGACYELHDGAAEILQGIVEGSSNPQMVEAAKTLLGRLGR